MSGLKRRYLVEIEWEEHISFAEHDEVEWLENEVFQELLVHSNVIGDTIGEMKVIEDLGE